MRRYRLPRRLTAAADLAASSHARNSGIPIAPITAVAIQATYFAPWIRPGRKGGLAVRIARSTSYSIGQ